MWVEEAVADATEQLDTMKVKLRAKVVVSNVS